MGNPELSEELLGADWPAYGNTSLEEHQPDVCQGSELVQRPGSQRRSPLILTVVNLMDVCQRGGWHRACWGLEFRRPEELLETAV